MSREKILHLAALAAVQLAPNENEANTAGRILARLIHEHPEFLTGDAHVSTVDPAIAFLVQTGADLIRGFWTDFLQSRPPPRKAAPPATPPTTPATPKPGPRKAARRARGRA